MRKFMNRSVAAHLLMSASIILIGVGISIVNLGIGIASAGLASGVYGYLLGAE